MSFNPLLWNRLELNQVPIYLRNDKPHWFVPNKSGDEILCRLSQDLTLSADLAARRFLDRLPADCASDYPGRASLLKVPTLRELWFHITNRCNLTCTHCLCRSCPEEKSEMPVDGVLKIADEAFNMGCRVFALTGGEPFIHKNFTDLIDGLLSYRNIHVVVLTNGMNLRNCLGKRHRDFDRFHLQISLDGLQKNHDLIRGNGKFDKLFQELKWLKAEGIPFTLSMCVEKKNLNDMPKVVDLAAEAGASNIHFMWYFIHGRGNKEDFVPSDRIFEYLLKAAEQAQIYGIPIDNIEAMKTQIFAPKGTIHDGSTAGWESAAVGPDGKLYPSAALVGIEVLATDMKKGLVSAWQESPVLEKIRRTSIVKLSSPWRFILGGGDMDHSFVHAGSFTGQDPYLPLYEKIALWLIAKEALQQRDKEKPALRLKMGDILESCGAHGSVALVHSNCLLALAQENSLTVVKEFYSDAAGDLKEDILNPVSYQDDLIMHIPEKFRFRGYGCGSPVMDADLKDGECVVDLGCGSGIECFIAARLIGKAGCVIGIDMLDPMLSLASQGAKFVSQNLGYKNLTFCKGYLENLPLHDNLADVVLSNCVMNLSVHKRRSFAEAFRVLKEGGRLVISDVVCETEPDAAIRNNKTLQGECIAGAMTQTDLLAILEESGFEYIYFIKRFPYRIVNGHPFFSLTLVARKPAYSEPVKVMYRGPFASVVTSKGKMMSPGAIHELSNHEAYILTEHMFILDYQGAVTNVELENTCACFISPEEKVNNQSQEDQKPDSGRSASSRFSSGCMVCGAPLIYLPEDKIRQCTYCKKSLSANAVCRNGHFVCNSCHSEKGLEVIEHICLETKETDMITLFKEIRKHPAIPMNGPEYHSLVPGIILTTYRNLGGPMPSSIIKTGIDRGAKVAGGYCAFMGVCGAAIGVGIAFSLILDANPLKPKERKIVQSVTQAVLAEIAALKAARCCQRDSWIALKKAAELSQTFLPIALNAEKRLTCHQQHQNTECMGINCPLQKMNSLSIR